MSFLLTDTLYGSLSTFSLYGVLHLLSGIWWLYYECCVSGISVLAALCSSAALCFTMQEAGLFFNDFVLPMSPVDLCDLLSSGLKLEPVCILYEP